MQPLSDVRSADARSAQIRSPAGVTRPLQVSAYKVEPPESILARNLLSKDDWRLALGDEVVEGGPKVPLVSKPRSLACRGERLARAGSGPDGATLWPSGELEREAPSADPGEEVALGEACQLCGCDVLDGSLVHNSVWYVLMGY